jgi:hypothetical protein
MADVIDLAATNAVSLPEEIWLDAVISSQIPLLGILAKRRRSERRFDWSLSDFNLVLTAIECQPDNEHYFSLLLENPEFLLKTVPALFTPERVDLWVGLFWGANARNLRLPRLLQFAATLLNVLTNAQVPAEARNWANQQRLF